MTKEDFKTIKLLSAKERLEKDGLYTMSKEEKKYLEELKKDFDRVDKCVSKTFFYMHYFLGIDYVDIAMICNYTYETVRTRCKELTYILRG